MEEDTLDDSLHMAINVGKDLRVRFGRPRSLGLKRIKRSTSQSESEMLQDDLI